VCSSDLESISLISRHKRIATGAELMRSLDRFSWACIFSGDTPSRLRSRSKSKPIASASCDLTDNVVTTQKRQGWRLWAEGAYVAVARMFWITESGTGSALNRRIDRRVRKKLCRSGVGVKMTGSDFENNSSLSLSIRPGFVIVFD